MKKILILFISFTILNLANAQWAQKGQDIDGENADDYFGGSVCINHNGNIIAAVSRYNDDSGYNYGHVRVFELNNGSWIQKGVDIDGDYNYSGHSLSMDSSGNRIAVGSPYVYDSISGNSTFFGQVKVFDWNGSNWNQVGHTIFGDSSIDYSGSSLSLNADGSYIAIGAPRNSDNGVDAGHVKVYNWDGSSWSQIGADIDGENAGDYSGGDYGEEGSRYVSINNSGNILAIGAYNNDGGGYKSGHVRVFEWDGADWLQMGLDIDGESSYDKCGIISLNASGHRIVIGAPDGGPGSVPAGQVKVYEWNGISWQQMGNNLNGEGSGDDFGFAVDMDGYGNRIAIGAKRNSGPGTSSDDYGHVRIYGWDGSSWSKIGDDIDGEAIDDFSGYSVALNAAGDNVIIGARSNDGNGSNSGHIRLFCAQSYYTDTLISCDSLIWTNGITYTTSNYSAKDTFINNAGCDSIVSLHLTILTSYSTDSVMACGSYTWINGITYTQNNFIAQDTLVNSSGCDSIINLHLILNNNTGIDTQSACGSYTWTNGITYFTNNYTDLDTLINISGCDSIVTLNLTINNIDTSITAASACDSFIWYDEVYYQSGNYDLRGIFEYGNEINGLNYYSGTSVALNSYGDRVVIGAPGFSQGKVFVYEMLNGIWTDVGSVIASITSYDKLGTSVSINYLGDIIAAGAPESDAAGTQAGHVSVHSYNGADWVKLGNDIYGENDNEFAGYSISLNASGNIIAVGAPDLGVIGNNASGQVRVYELDSNTWVKMGNDINGGYGDETGYSVALDSSGHYLIVGSPGANKTSNNASDAGSAIVYHWDGTDWQQIGDTKEGGSSFHRLGTSVDIDASGNRIAAGAPRNGSSQWYEGYVMIYELDSTSWNSLGTSPNSDHAGDDFGASLALSGDGNSLIVGALDNDQNGTDAGMAKMFYWDGTSWILEKDTLIGEYSDKYGTSVSINKSGNIIAVGAPNNNTTASLHGQVSLYKTSLTNVYGCDSIVSLNLTILKSYATDSVMACGSYTWTNGVTYTQDNFVAQDTLVNSSGCDSIIKLHLTLKNNTGFDNQTACNSYTWTNGITYYTSNFTALDTLLNVAGCDSVVTLNLIIDYSPQQVNNWNWICDSVTIDGFTYTNDTSFIDTLINLAGCDTLMIWNLTVNNSTSMIDTITTCDSYTWIDGITYTRDTSKTDTLVNLAGCDSIVTLALTINSINDSVETNGPTLTASALGANYQWVNCDSNYSIITGENGQNYTATSNGNYAVIIDQNSCIDTSDCYSVISVSLMNNNFDETPVLFPNPTLGDITIDFEKMQENINVSITTIDGRLISKTNHVSVNKLQLSLNGNAGIYFIDVYSNKGTSARYRLVKK